MPPFSIVVSAHHGNGSAYCRRYAISDFRTGAQVDPHACEKCAFECEVRRASAQAFLCGIQRVIELTF
jgi:hypothetical protein